MKAKVDLFDLDFKSWIVAHVGVDNFFYDFASSEVEFVYAEDFAAFLIKFGNKYEPSTD